MRSDGALLVPSALPIGSGFEFATATRIVFGRGRVAELPGLVAPLGHRALVVLGRDVARHRNTLNALQAAGVSVHSFQVEREPTVQLAEAGVDLARAAGVDVVIGLGGGSVVDAAKAIAALVSNPGPPLDYLEVIGRGKPLAQPSLPFIAVPTTSGTGAEVTKNAVLESPEHGVKVSLRSDSMLPRLALVDPALTLTVPQAVTALTGLDALTQLIEPYLSRRANPLVDAISLAGIRHAREGLRAAFRDGENLDAREHMSLASLFGGLSLANAKLGAVHGIAGPLGGLTGAAHGALCARLLPASLVVNLRALNERAPEHPARQRLSELGALLTGSASATAKDAIAWIDALVSEFAVPGLTAQGLTLEQIPELVKKAQRASSMQGNPVPLSDEEVTAIIEACL